MFYNTWMSARISKWIVQLQEFDNTVMVEESTRAALADILTHQFREKKEKKESNKETPPAPPVVKEIEEAFALYFDGAYRKKEGKAVAGIVVFNPANEKVMEREVWFYPMSLPTMRLNMQLYSKG